MARDSDVLVVYLDGAGMSTDDEAIASCFDYACKVLGGLNGCYSKYLTILAGVTQRAVVSGETSDAIRAFARSAARLQGVYDSARSDINRAKNGFLAAVAAADRIKF